MATQRTTLGVYNVDPSDASKSVTIEYTYDDVTHKVQTVELTNDSDVRSVTIRCLSYANRSELASFTVNLKGGLRVFNIPQSGGNSITLTQTPKGYWVLPFIVETSFA